MILGYIFAVLAVVSLLAAFSAPAFGNSSLLVAIYLSSALGNTFFSFICFKTSDIYRVLKEIRDNTRPLAESSTVDRAARQIEKKEVVRPDSTLRENVRGSDSSNTEVGKILMLENGKFQVLTAAGPRKFDTLGQAKMFSRRGGF